MKKQITKLLCSLLVMTFIITSGCSNTVKAATLETYRFEAALKYGVEITLKAKFDSSIEHLLHPLTKS